MWKFDAVSWVCQVDNYFDAFITISMAMDFVEWLFGFKLNFAMKMFRHQLVTNYWFELI